jgi:hypothetical protein
LLDSVKATPSFLDESRPATSFAAGLLRDEMLACLIDLFDSQTEDRPASLDFEKVAGLRLLRKFADNGALAPLDRYLGRIGRSRRPQGSYNIALATSDVTVSVGSSQGFFGMGLGLAENLFPRDSWCATFIREVVLAANGKAAYTQQELNRLYASPETGPLCCLTAAMILKRAGLPQSEAFATRGLAALDTESLLRDARPLMDEQGMIGLLVRQTAESLRSLDEVESAVLVRRLPEEDVPWLNEALGALRAQKEAPLDEALSQALSAAWEQGLRARVEAALESYLPEDTFRIGAKP